MKIRLMSLALTAVLVPALVLVPLGAKADAGQTLQGALWAGGMLQGRVQITGLMVGEAGITVSGTVTDIATPSTGPASTATGQRFTARVDSIRANYVHGPASPPLSPNDPPPVCDILFLQVNEIELNLLGLEVETDVITVDVDAVPGDGNLLGNLLCALLGLLDP
jgi:hypothetical protein